VHTYVRIVYFGMQEHRNAIDTDMTFLQDFHIAHFNRIIG